MDGGHSPVQWLRFISADRVYDVEDAKSDTFSGSFRLDGQYIFTFLTTQIINVTFNFFLFYPW
jgi:hypothetical protein